MSDDGFDPVQRDSDLAYELYDVRPEHPEIGHLARRALAAEPWRSGLRVLLANHLEALGELDESREILLAVVGQRDHAFVDAARDLRDLEHRVGRYEEALRWAETVLGEDSEGWSDWGMFGAIKGQLGEPTLTWQILDEAVERCATTAPDELTDALAFRATGLIATFAPSERFIAAAEEAVRADPANGYVALCLVWAYIHQGRFDDAEELALRMLREDPTDEGPAIPVRMLRTVRGIMEREGMDMAELHRHGILERMWTDQRDRLLGVDVVSALTALEPLLPPAVLATLHPPIPEDGDDTGACEELVSWHDGQDPGAGDAWRLPGDFRLMSAAEIRAMDAAVEADPASYPQWAEDSLDSYYQQLMTDDAGGYLIVTITGELAIRRAGAEDEVVSASIADFFWEQVAARGGRNPRPRPQPRAQEV
ncbi:tetratricopeptide repeat protein [Nocardioides caeni]|uniref:Tetratricopeptide repeat protein n=1 Tax=Nocardioides caeni TaxID=574700 RepID=A0A4S8N3H4_9ACTN|nr:tetratricopeptide repeat protein [Nocardioides caeni]THV10081.1 tetratricopeptide repeat protein [Nocardioides caeni]